MKQITGYVQLCPADESALFDTMCDNGYEDLGDHWVPCMDEDGNMDVMDSIVLAGVNKAKIVNVVGDRCYASEVAVMTATDGSVWIDVDKVDEYFA